jgi:sugar lactone lactonase YvrE
MRRESNVPSVTGDAANGTLMPDVSIKVPLARARRASETLTPFALALTACLAAFLTAVVVALATAPPARARLEVSVFARVPAPGYPANAIVGRGGRIYTGTFHSFSSPSDTGPSKVFGYSPNGKLVRQFTISGQTPGAAHGVQVATTDRNGTLYLLDQAPARVLKLDPRTGRQTTWATFASVPACATGHPDGGCTLGSGGNPPEPDFAAWGTDGSLYVTDYNQSLIWRVPPRGGRARVWLTDPRFNGIIVGPAGIELLADHRSLMLSTGGGGSNPSTGKLYKVRIESDGKPGALHQIWESGSADAPDGFAVARSGHIYIALVGPFANAVLELSASGRQLARVPSNPIANSMLPVPFDAPGSVAFDGERVIVSNQSAINNDPAHWALLAIAVGERGLPLFLPPAPAKNRYHLRAAPRRATAGRRTRFRFTATVIVAGHRRPLAGALVRFAGHRARTNRRGHATIVARVKRRGRYRAVLRWTGRRRAVVTVRVVAAVSRSQEGSHG